MAVRHGQTGIKVITGQRPHHSKIHNCDVTHTQEVKRLGKTDGSWRVFGHPCYGTLRDEIEKKVGVKIPEDTEVDCFCEAGPHL